MLLEYHIHNNKGKLCSPIKPGSGVLTSRRRNPKLLYRYWIIGTQVRRLYVKTRFSVDSQPFKASTGVSAPRAHAAERCLCGESLPWVSLSLGPAGRRRDGGSPAPRGEWNLSGPARRWFGLRGWPAIRQ